jgi:hypothetical protein
VANFINNQPASRILGNQYLQYTGNQASVPSTTFSPQTYHFRIISQVAGYLVVDSVNVAATAQSSSMFIPASTVGGEYFKCVPGQAVAFISTSTTTGCVNITEMT